MSAERRPNAHPDTRLSLEEAAVLARAYVTDASTASETALARAKVNHWDPETDAADVMEHLILLRRGQ